MSAPPAFTCPKCGRTSYHPEDVRHGFCGNCHRFTGEGPRYAPTYGDHFVEGMFFDPDGKALTTVQWGRLYHSRFDDLSPGAWWRAGLDVVTVAGRQLEVSTVWEGINRNLPFMVPGGMWETAVFVLIGDTGERGDMVGALGQLYATREQARAGHMETVDRLTRLAAAPESADAIMRAFLDVDDES